LKSSPSISAAVALVLAAAHAVQAQTPQPTGTTMPTVIVSGQVDSPSLTVPSISDARIQLEQVPGGTAVVDAETFKRGRATTLKDALDFAPGVYVQPRFGAEEARISIRGSGIQRTFHGRGLKLLQDGVPINQTDGGFDFQAIEPLATRYIEVYRGGNALEYGATTLGGAINFVSATGYDASPFTARFEYGSFESYRGQVSSGGVFGPLDYYVSLSHFSQDGFREHSQQNNQRVFANIGYRFNENVETRFYFTFAQTDSELPGNLTKEQLETDPTQAQRVDPALRGIQAVARFDNVTSNWKRDFELFRIANKTTWLNGDHRFALSAFWAHKDLDHPILFFIDQLSNDFGLDLRYDYTGELFGHRNHFTIGFAPTYGITQDNRFANVFGNRAARLTDNETESWNLDLYVQDSFYLTPNLALVAGAQVTYARRENEDDFPVTPTNLDNSDTQDWWGFSPKVGLLWQQAKTVQSFLNVSRSFEPASFGELTNAATGGAGLVQLDPQTATTIEVGTRGRLGRFAWDLAYYYSWIDNELLELQVAPGLTQTVNAGRTIHQGVEVALDVDLFRGIFVRDSAAGPTGDGKTVATPAPVEPKRDRIVLRQLYLFNDFHFDGDAEFGDNQLPGIPEHYYRAELLYEHPCGFYVGPNVEWVPTKYNVDSAETLHADSYALLGAKIGYRSERGFSVFFEGKNLADEKYAATTGVVSRALPTAALFMPGDGRGFFGGVEFRW
jgi:iron complex outermembrane recepter protein